MLTREEMIERINALEEEFFLTIVSYTHNDSAGYNEAHRLKMLILQELELI